MQPRDGGDGMVPVSVDVEPLRVGYATCDRCGAVASVRVVVDPRKRQCLDFCYGHFVWHERALARYPRDDQSGRIVRPAAG